jgi:tetratricopeptide (TPR) repeat protein
MGTGSIRSEFFVPGGTLRPDAPSYVKRPADDELFGLALAGKFCYVLTARQLGKSSLMIRTAQRLQAEGVKTVSIDLSSIGTEVTTEQWYQGLILNLKTQLMLPIDLETWHAEHASLGPVQRFTRFLRDVVLEEIEDPVVVFVDEIDTTLRLDFSDDFFAATRFIYNARANDSVYNRLTFVLLGMAMPTDLIKDHTRTPFNIGEGIALREFSRQDALVLERGLRDVCPEQGEAIFARIFYWTSGHPYLTQKLCSTAAEKGNGHWTDERVDSLVQDLFISEEARRETNLQFVRDSINASPERRKLLTLYRRIYGGKEVPEDERSLIQNRLKLFGLVRADGGTLKVRNEIYRHVFAEDWIKETMPANWALRIALISTALLVVVAALFGYSLYRQGQQTIEIRAQQALQNLQETNSDEVRITSLSNLFQLSGYEVQAREWFFSERTPEQQVQLFELANPQAVGAQLITVVQGLYTELEDNEQDNALLNAMAKALRRLDDPVARTLAAEIELWLEGRAYYANGEYQQALVAYDAAIRLKDDHPGTYFDRALVYAASGEPTLALDDLEEVLSLSERWQVRVKVVVEGHDALYAALWRAFQDYPRLAALVPTPTPSPTPTHTPTSTQTPRSPTSTPTVTPRPPTWTPSATPEPPTATLVPTNTPLPPTATPTPTHTAQPPTSTPTPTSTPLPPTWTPTERPKPKPTSTNTPKPPVPTSTNSPQPSPPTATNTPKPSGPTRGPTPTPA